MQSVALFINLVRERERLPVLIVMDRRGLWCGRLLTESTTAEGGDAHGGGKLRLEDSSGDMPLPWRAHI